MGYSFYTIAKNKASQKKMFKFMNSNYKPWKEVFKNKQIYVGGFTDPIIDPSYCDHKLAIGFDFNGMGSERSYCFNITRWMALKIGKIRSKIVNNDGKTYKSEYPIPFVVYDGNDFWPVIQLPLSKTPKKWKWCSVDDLGIIRDSESLGQQLLVEFGDYKDLVKIAQFREKHPQRINEAAGIIMKNKISEVRKIMRAEFKRLDDLWEQQK